MEVLTLRYKGVDYTQYDVAEIVGIIPVAAFKRMKKALKGEIRAADVFRPKGQHVTKPEKALIPRLPDDLTLEQFETLQEFDKKTRNDDKYYNKHYA